MEEKEKEAIQDHIASKTIQIGEIICLQRYLDKLELTKETRAEVNAKTSSRFAQLERSIEDHKKLL